MQTKNTIAQAVQSRDNNRSNGRGGEFGDFMVRSTTETAANRQSTMQASRTDNARDDRNQHGSQAQNTQNTQASSSEASQQQAAQAAQESTGLDCGDYAAFTDAVITDIVIDEDALLAEMAAILGITLEQLTELLAQLDLPVEELLEADNRLELILAAKGLDGHGELANHPEALSMVQKLAQAMENNAVVTTFANPLDAEADMLLEADITAELAQAAQAASHESSTTTAMQTTELPTAMQSGELAMQNIQQATQIENSPLAMVMPTAADVPANTSAGNVSDAGTSIPTQTVTPQNIVNQIVSNVRLFTGEGMAEIRIKLTPAQLGDLSMRVATINGIVTAQFIADSQRVKELIEAGLNMLRDSLEEAGIVVQDIEVNVRGEGGFHDFENETEVSDSRIRELMAQGELEAQDAEEAPVATEDNLVDYRV